MSISIMILEDMTLYSDALVQMLHTYSDKLEVSVAHTLEEAHQLVEGDHRFRLFFLDIALSGHADDISGLRFAQYLSKIPIYKHTPVIFTTSFPEYVYEALNTLHCYAYLLKPFRQDEVFFQLDKLFDLEDFIRLKTMHGVYTKIRYTDLYYIQSFGRVMHFMTRQGEICSRQYSMKALTELLPGQFARCHKSFIINQDYVESVNYQQNLLRIQDVDEEIPYGKNFHYTM